MPVYRKAYYTRIIVMKNWIWRSSLTAKFSNQESSWFSWDRSTEFLDIYFESKISYWVLSSLKNGDQRFSVLTEFALNNCHLWNLTYWPLSVRMCITRVTRVSAPLGQFSTSSSSSGDSIPIPFTWNTMVIIMATWNGVCSDDIRWLLDKLSTFMS